MDIPKKVALAEAYLRCEKEAEHTWVACLEERKKPPTDAGCLHIKSFVRITCIGDAKRQITGEYQ